MDTLTEVKSEARKKKKTSDLPFLFIHTSLFILLIGLLFGVIGGLQYIFPDFLFNYFGFNKIRPLHVTFVITWIFNGAIGGIYYYLPKITGRNLYSNRLAKIHFWLFIFSTFSIFLSYCFNYFGGREYLEYPPILAIPIALSWILFMINFFKTIKRKTKWPVYLWMWTTGIVFFLITYGESYLWIIPYFRDNIIRDITVQWKSLGSMVGSWNMLVYGTAFYLMEKISGDDSVSRSPKTFILFFIGLTNLMFNWGHHTYIVPAASYVKNISYFISMTELILLGNIIWSWRKTLSTAAKHINSFPYRFLIAAEIWIFLNLILAIIISIPTINYYTHGTHITVAHAMGATIGINTMILLASVFYILSKEDENYFTIHTKSINKGFWISNISLLIFWISLIGAGIIKSYKMRPGVVSNFNAVMKSLSVFFEVFTLSGITLFIGILILGIPAARRFFRL